jgi:ribonuclease R
VIERANERIVGTWHETAGKTDRLEPEDPKIFHAVRATDPEGLHPTTGQKVVVRVTRWPEPGRDAEGEVLKVLGAEGSPTADLYQVALQFNLEEDFPPRLLADADAVPEEIPEKTLAGRRDFRDRLTITIDPENAKDFDDALSLYTDEKTGNTIVLVSIADVSYFVKQDTALDEEALKRGCSVYLGSGVIPMLPPRLSGRLCSLIQGEDRLAKTVLFEFDADHRLLNSVIMPSVIRVDQRMTFNEVNAVLEAAEAADEGPGAVAALKLAPALLDMILKLDRASEALRAEREASGSIDLDMPEFDVMMDTEGRVIGVSKTMRDRAHCLVEDMMLLANRTVARFLKENNLPCVYRVHEPPDEEAVALFADFVDHVIGRTVDPTDRKALQELIDEVDGTPLSYPVNLQLLRSFKRAQYSGKPGLHYALHFELYCHFTSPVRRYPDLAVHQILDHYFAGKLASAKRSSRWRGKLGEIARHATEMEYNATEAEREYLKVSLLRFLSARIGETFDAVITGLHEIGFFVQLVDYALEGLVKANTIGDDYYRHIPAQHAIVGSRKGRTFRLGDRLRVKLDDIDVRRRQADFLLVR